jgi:hypothetical protein
VKKKNTEQKLKLALQALEALRHLVPPPVRKEIENTLIKIQQMEE